MKCLICGKEITDEEAKYCPECGVLLPKKKKQCPNCNTTVDYNDLFCKNCGAALEDSETIFSDEVVEPIVVKEEITELSKQTKTFSIVGFILSFVPISFILTRLAAIALSIVALAKISKERKENKNIKYKTHKTLSILGIIIPAVSLLVCIALYVIFFIFMWSGSLDSIFEYIPEYFL